MGDFKSYFTKGSGSEWTPQSHYGARVPSIDWQMDGNGPGDNPPVSLPGVPTNWQGCGDCTVAAMAHAFTIANFEVPDSPSLPSLPSANACVLAYCELRGMTTTQLFTDPTGYDWGVSISPSLGVWRKFGLFGVKLGAYAPVDYTNMDDIRNALHLAGGLVVGIQFQQAQLYGPQHMGTWSWVPGSGPDAVLVGGHTITLTGYSVALGRFWGVTWGQLIPISEDFLSHALDEAYALVSAQAVAYGKGPTGLNVKLLEADLKVRDY